MGSVRSARRPSPGGTAHRTRTRDFKAPLQVLDRRVALGKVGVARVHLGTQRLAYALHRLQLRLQLASAPKGLLAQLRSCNRSDLGVRRLGLGLVGARLRRVLQLSRLLHESLLRQDLQLGSAPAAHEPACAKDRVRK